MGTVRRGQIRRQTKETTIEVDIGLQGRGHFQVDSGIGFFDHMLAAFARHSLFDLVVQCQGDLEVDGHHSVEDIGLCLGQAFAEAVGDGRSIERFGHGIVPMDEALVQVIVDISGRPHLSENLDIREAEIGNFASCLTREFLQAFVNQAKITLHVRQLAGNNGHHIVEAVFKALGRSLRDGVQLNPQVQGVLSTKGSLDMGKDAD